MISKSRKALSHIPSFRTAQIRLLSMLICNIQMHKIRGKGRLNERLKAKGLKFLFIVLRRRDKPTAMLQME